MKDNAMRKNTVRIMFLLFASLIVACGRNDGVPDTTNNRTAPPEADAQGLSSKRAALSRHGHWSLVYNWSIGPRMGGESLVENHLLLGFVGQEGMFSTNVANVSVVGWMPDHGHDTGNEKPTPKIRADGLVPVKNIFFIMTGVWEFIVKAEVDGLADEYRFSVDIVD
jgi:hypothetical protein